jgi:predicted 3-demethylubiquinone-9 3-methyltransferase (glyoxalase superfamily)
MLQNIIPHIWFDKEAKEATELYVTLFPDSHIDSVHTIKGTPSGDCDTVSFTLSGQKFAAISAGPVFTLNSSISFFAVFDNETDITHVWEMLSDGGKILMPFATYPWATKYGWLQDKYGVSWQLSMSEHHETGVAITPMMMFTQGVAGKAAEAIDLYSSVFPLSTVDMKVSYEEGEGDVKGYLKHARFTLDGTHFMAMDSTGPHEFTFNEALSFMVLCDNQGEIDYYSDKLSAHSDAERCGWIKDTYGVSWQIIPRNMEELMKRDTPEKSQEVMQAMMHMKRLSIEGLKNAGR